MKKTRITQHDKDVLNMQIMIIEEIHNQWNLSFKDTIELLVKYNLLDYIKLSYDIYNSKGLYGALEDLKNAIDYIDGKINA